jgi:hypothetical protein
LASEIYRRPSRKRQYARFGKRASAFFLFVALSGTFQTADAHKAQVFSLASAVGPVVAAGWLVAALTGAAASTVAATLLPRADEVIE